MDKTLLAKVEEKPTPLGGLARTLVDKPDLRLVLLRVPAGTRVAEHNAPVEVVFLVTSGSGVIHTDAGETPIMAGEMLACPAGIPRAISANDADLELLVVRAPNL